MTRQPSLPHLSEEPIQEGLGEIEQARALLGEHFWIGTDEAGRGPLAGPVHAAAVCLPPGALIEGLDDSKRLTELRRERLFPKVCEIALAYAVVEVSAAEIDHVNILRASLGAMHRAIAEVTEILSKKNIKADCALIDGKQNVLGPWRSVPYVKGDQRSLNIAAASILAKVSRDRDMIAMDAQYPGYGLSKHKGYPTAAHRAAVAELGPSPEHRQSFRGVREHCDPKTLPIRSDIPSGQRLDEVQTRVLLSGGKG